ncbi:MAG: hypothetical protein HQM14_19685 [SAR324 cluster bacterium]|nr:hypothetical protein [SAR324 cluster bacterium]
MFFLESLFRNKKGYPPLDFNSTAIQQLDKFQEPLGKICLQTSDPVELVPTDETCYIFLGNPPRRFAMTWIDKDNSIHKFKSLAKDKGVSQAKFERLAETIGEAYRQSKGEARFSLDFDNKTITVTVSQSLADHLKQVINEAIT